MAPTTLGGCILVALASSNALAFLLARLRPLNHPCGTNAGPLGKVPLKLWSAQASNPGLLFLTACVHTPDRSPLIALGVALRTPMYSWGGVYHTRDEGGYALRTHVLEWPRLGACFGSCGPPTFPSGQQAPCAPRRVLVGHCFTKG